MLLPAAWLPVADGLGGCRREASWGGYQEQPWGACALARLKAPP